jgi:hypothetical protein
MRGGWSALITTDVKAVELLLSAIATSRHPGRDHARPAPTGGQPHRSPFAEGLQLRRVRVMTYRIELCGFTDAMRERLSAYGLFHEIISWKLRMFIPADAGGPAVLAKVLERYPIERIGEREAA